MWDTAEDGRQAEHLSHDLLCSRCGHAMHTFLACSDTCDCLPGVMPGGLQELAG